MTNKQELLNQLIQLGISPTTGRKQRSDKGQIRGPNANIRSDAGIKRGPTYKSPLSIYLSTKTRLLNNPNNNIQQDINNIFIVYERENTTKEGYFTVIHRGKKLNRTVVHMKGKTTDLEKLRFQALQDVASNELIPEQYQKAFHQEIALTKATTWFELFCRFYHVTEETALLWTYERWFKDYSIVNDQVLEPDFKFNIDYSPGTQQFLPEYADVVLKQRQDKIDKLKLSKQYINARARYIAEEEARYEPAIKTRILSDPANIGLSMLAIDQLVKKELPNDLIATAVEEKLNKWIDDQMKEVC